MQLKSAIKMTVTIFNHMAGFANRWKLFHFIVGILIGFVVTTQFRTMSLRRWTPITSPKTSSALLKSDGSVHEGVFNQSTSPCYFNSEAKGFLHQALEMEHTIEKLKSQVKSGSTSKLVLIGVMTAQKYLDSRALNIYHTWGKSVPGMIIFFSSANSKSDFGLPLISLPSVDDSYPPQKKSFLMLKFMHDHFGDQFKWFMRADDDVFVRTERLESFLKSINSSLLQFIGQGKVFND